MSWRATLLTFLSAGLYRPPLPEPDENEPVPDSMSTRQKIRACSDAKQESIVRILQERSRSAELRDMTCRLDTNDPKYRDLIESSRNGTGK